jgi:hypothetical protein
LFAFEVWLAAEVVSFLAGVVVEFDAVELVFVALFSSFFSGTFVYG